ncbi:MAG: Nramp family divalent metal transporter [Firmicutes bacterium]|nr:Nramp family divalent metal transporter [Bacillota bacterium]
MGVSAVGRWSRFGGRLLAFLAVMGPGIITMNVDNDPGGITTYSVMGARYGYRMLWTLIPMTLLLAVVQEMSARMGLATGKGLGDLIRERFGLRVTVLVMALLVLTNFGNILSEFAGVAAAGQLLGLPAALAVALVAALVWWLVVRGSYRFVERVMLALTLLYFAYPASAWLARPDWGLVLRSLVHPVLQADPEYVNLLMTAVGTTIAPWMIFYQQALTIDKGLTWEDYPAARADTYLGSFMTNFVPGSLFMIVACAAVLYPAGIRIETAAQAAQALAPLAGRYASLLFAVGLLNAAALSASVVPLSTAHVVAEAFGWESRVGRRFREAPAFLGLYTAFIVLGALAVLWPGLNLIEVMLVSQLVNGIVLPLVLVFMLILVNDRAVMGAHVNGAWQNLLAYAGAALLVGIDLLLLLQGLFPGLLLPA